MAEGRERETTGATAGGGHTQSSVEEVVCGSSLQEQLDQFGELALPVVLAKTASRQMLGFVNEMAWFAECAIADAGGLGRCDIAELNREQRRMLHNRDGRYVRPLELVRKRQELA